MPLFTTEEDNSVQFTTFRQSSSTFGPRYTVSELPTGGRVFWRSDEGSSLQQIVLGANSFPRGGSRTIEQYELLFVPNADFFGDAGELRGIFVSTSLSSGSPRNYEFDVTPVNDAPRGILLSDYSISENTPGDAVGIITTVDPDVGNFHTLQLVGDISGNFEISSGTLRLRDGVMVDYEQDQSFEVRIRSIDNTGLAFEQTITVNVENFVPEVISGSFRGEDLAGTNADDEIRALGGDDVVLALAGDDTVQGQSGNDSLFGGEGNDSLLGGDGADLVRGGTDDDFISGQDGNDTLNGDKGDDILFGGNGDDRLLGSGGDDTLIGGSGEDTLLGNIGDDRLVAGGGPTVLNGGAGRDVMFAGAGEDTFVWRSASESGPRADRDTIHNFDTTEDLLDLSRVSIDDLLFQGLSGFAGGGDASLRLNETSAGHSVVRVDIDGDRVTDMEILLLNTVTLTADDFIL
ncbi:M10 family metallopeptidase C-terminal domain-containing protein [uncultured Sulfitobacter sp.]|uniref:calcium-binding protein n=1 Tax=uncultured Sulfitobacter sp. TaxID=191468 RepID=UPI002603BA92|nr:M10 family metallopeptidase C-terminal domain-containing protein [uncultured Sulfitobacter sp.]